MATIVPATIIENSRADYRRTLTELFLNEPNGAAGAPSDFEYNVETDDVGNRIYLKRPTNLNKGFDFEVRVSNQRFKHVGRKGRVSHSNRPSHGNIIDAFTFQSGCPVDMICRCIKWLFIEQDITYWNWSGRNMLYNGIRSI